MNPKLTGTAAAWKAVVLLVVMLLLGCSQDPAPPAQPRPVTAEEAQLLATTRFLNYNAGSRSMSADIPIRDQSVHVTGLVDYTTHTGFGTATGRGFAPQLLRWNLGTVAVQPAPAGTSEKPPAPMPTTGWQTRTMDPQRSDLDLVLLVTSQLGLDRPENPILLQQGGALWLGTERVDGRLLTHYAAPPTDKPASPAASIAPDTSGLRLWIDEEGLLHRSEIRASSGWVSVVFGAGAGATLPALPSPSGAPS